MEKNMDMVKKIDSGLQDCLSSNQNLSLLQYH
ncbi:hypothetical protein IGI49_000936 [Enterococcus sp. AZ071]